MFASMLSNMSSGGSSVSVSSSQIQLAKDGLLELEKGLQKRQLSESLDLEQQEEMEHERMIEERRCEERRHEVMMERLRRPGSRGKSREGRVVANAPIVEGSPHADFVEMKVGIYSSCMST